MTQPITTVPYVMDQFITYDLPDGAPDVTSGSSVIVPTRISIRYSQHETLAISHVIEVNVKGRFRDQDGTVSNLGHTVEVWRHTPAESRPAWVAELVADNLPIWWTA